MTKETEWKCSQCGLEVIILIPEEMNISIAECQNCNVKTLRRFSKEYQGPIGGLTDDDLLWIEGMTKSLFESVCGRLE